MTNAIVYSSQTGNTKMLAEAIKEELEGENLLYFGAPDALALKADRIFVGFWTDKGSCDPQTEQFLMTLTDQQVYFFGTAGFGESQDYFDKVLGRTETHLGKSSKVIGSFMCQGKMPLSVRQRYEKMLHSPGNIPNIQSLIENFDKALSHPDQRDLDHLRKAIRELS